MESSTTGPPLPAAIYARISSDPTGQGLGVERQETECRALAERNGWEVVGAFVDNDISAYSGKPRPQYEAMLGAVRSGRVKAIVAWHPDRLHRRTTELESFINVCDSTGVRVATVTAGDLDLSTDTGQMIARIVGAVAQKEAAQTRGRVRAAKKQAAVAGKYRGGMRPYGYEADGVTIREDEADVIREASTAVLAGRSLAAVARDLSDKGLTTSRGKPWTYGLLRDVLMRPRNAGLLSTGRASRGTMQIVGKAVWDAVVPEETWRAVHGLLNDASRRSETKGNVPRWLGSGIYLCGHRQEDPSLRGDDAQEALCGTPLRPAPYGATPKSNRRTRTYLYRCTAKAHLTISSAQTDEYVRDIVAGLLRDPRVVAGLSPQDDGRLAGDREERMTLLARLEQFENDYAAGSITAALLTKSSAMVTAQLADVEARIAEGLRRSTASPIVNAVDPAQEFLDAPVDVQRALLRELLTVEVLPNPRRGGTWTDKRLRLTDPATGEVLKAS
ncbi:recombinase family protein [Terrabacter sp. RAF57]|uniref:recombinase family protein n=1 Tax=Terrabacter sp. RAF57 TaxID=3233063 RepID=UPI003F9D5618